MKNNKKIRIPKSLKQKLEDLESHLYLLKLHTEKLSGNSAHLKVISAELRVLVCESSGTEGLLWRLVKELNVNDEMFLHLPGKLNRNHPLARGLHFMYFPIKRGGTGDPKLPPNNHSLKSIIKEDEALMVGGVLLSHEYLIKAISQQMGTAHEDDGLEPALVELKSIFINGTEPFVPVLATDADLTLEIGERVLKQAEKQLGYERREK